jgi:proteic killer suppression protein
MPCSTNGKVIRSFKNRETEKAFHGEFSRGIPADLVRRVKMRLDRIDAAVALDDLRVPPSHHLEALKGNRRGQHSIRVNDQWRICFVWDDGGASEVELVDYH